MGIINSQKFLIGGHRGSPKKKRENTIESFEEAIKCGADFIEFDIRTTSDGILVIHHDASAEGIEIASLSYSSLNSASYKIPTLLETLKLCKGRIMLDAEIKEPEITETAVREILEFYDPEEFVVTSFYDEAVKTVKQNFPGVMAGLLFDKDTDMDIGKRVDALNPDLLLPHYTIFDQYRELYKNSGLRTILWTVNDEKDIRKFKNDSRVLGIISDYPERGNT